MKFVRQTSPEKRSDPAGSVVVADRRQIFIRVAPFEVAVARLWR
jgi:hypothetical protein